MPLYEVHVTLDGRELARMRAEDGSFDEYVEWVTDSSVGPKFKELVLERAANDDHLTLRQLHWLVLLAEM